MFLFCLHNRQEWLLLFLQHILKSLQECLQLFRLLYLLFYPWHLLLQSHFLLFSLIQKRILIQKKEKPELADIRSTFTIQQILRALGRAKNILSGVPNISEVSFVFTPKLPGVLLSLPHQTKNIKVVVQSK